ncbi:ionic transporter y4hA [uncultured Nocardioides sp.]|jgi:Ca2+:H+ antiporter|uniref:calcium:proton antiporter n=1 Tax=uncultured Nocardioides sp. TaxID=198441 RepID=UPI000C52331E|nr:ionic transporter y4hA [uncultured Nocardioides sp.]MAY96637.1 ionic transporter y4hA [Nocardioides sp.]
MSSPARRGPLQWTVAVPLLGLLLLALSWPKTEQPLLLALVAVVLVGAVLAAVHHAEVVAHRVGEPFGSLVLAVSVTVIEVGLIVMLTLGGGEGAATYARDTVFAALMISLNGIVGISLLLGAMRHGVVAFNASGSGAALSTVVALASVCLVLPGFTVSEAGLEYTGSQLAFAAVASLVLYAAFVFTQTVQHRDFFLPVRSDSQGRVTGVLEVEDEDGDGHADPPSDRETLLSIALLLVSLVSVVGLAKVLSPTIESTVSSLGLPYAVVGVVIALLVLAPESIAAALNAARDRVQVSLNLAFGSSMASIGLTIPTIAVASIWLEGDLLLGLEPMQIVLLLITVVVATLTVVPGRAKPIQGVVHLALMATFLFFSLVP